jgi:hypothetical protein
MPLLGIFVIGCGGSDDSTKDLPPSSKGAKKGGSSSKTPDSKEPAAGGGGAAAVAGATELESTGSGTLKGKVFFDGKPPAPTTVKMEKDPG